MHKFFLTKVTYRASGFGVFHLKCEIDRWIWSSESFFRHVWNTETNILVVYLFRAKNLKRGSNISLLRDQNDPSHFFLIISIIFLFLSYSFYYRQIYSIAHLVFGITCSFYTGDWRAIYTLYGQSTSYISEQNTYYTGYILMQNIYYTYQGRIETIYNKNCIR